MQRQQISRGPIDSTEESHPESSWSLARCSNCSTVGYAGDRYCPACGAPMQRRCPVCGAPVEHMIAAYCTRCGAELSGEGPPKRGAEE